MSEPPRQGPSSENPESNSELPECAFDPEHLKAASSPISPPPIEPPFMAPSSDLNIADELSKRSTPPATLLNADPQTIAPSDFKPSRHRRLTTQMPTVAPITGQLPVSGRPFGLSPNLLFIGALLTAAVLVGVIAAAALSVQDDLSNEVAVAETSLVELSTVLDSPLLKPEAALPDSPTVTRPSRSTSTTPSTSSTTTSASPTSTTTATESSDSFSPVPTEPIAPSSKPPTTVLPSPEECDPNYAGCTPVGEDVSCARNGDGPLHQSRPAPATGKDIYGVDGDKNQIACG